MSSHWAAWISVIITVVTILFAATARFVSLDEASNIARAQITDHERRIGSIERDKSSDTKFNNLEKSILELKWEVGALREQLEKKHGR
jgi:hypothetical protein